MASEHRFPGNPSFRLPSREAEADLVRRLKRGDSEALDDILRIYWNDLLRLAVRILDDEDRAEDAVQEAFLRLWEHRQRWTRTETLRPVLYRIVRNQCIDEKRRSNIVQKCLHKVSRSEQDPAPSPLAGVEDGQVRELVSRAMDGLPERRREIFLLVRHHHMSYREAAETLGLSAQTVANQMSLALKDLREALEPYLSDNGPRQIPFSRAGSR